METIDTSEKNVTDKITALQIMVTDFKRSLTGHSQIMKGNTWEYNGDVLTGEKTASKLSGLLQSFCHEANLITVKDDKKISWQKYENVITAINGLLLDDGCPAENNTTVIKMFKNTAQNVLDVIQNSRGVVKNSFGTEPEVKKDNDY